MSDRVEAYLSFVRSRHQAWEMRQLGLEPPWSDDPIVQRRKFTNVFRVLDHGTQWWLTQLAPTATRRTDQLYLALFYRFTNSTDGWDEYKRRWGGYPHLDDDAATVGQRFVEIQRNGPKVFSGAYMSRGWTGEDKAMTYARLCHELAQGIALDYELAESQKERFEILLAPYGMGKFMAMQVLTDLGYLRGADEDEFIVAGPGAVKGCASVFPGVGPEEGIYSAQRLVHEELPQVGLDLPDGTRRLPSLMDIQNTFCEYSKYVRYRERPLPAHPYFPAHQAEEPTYPQHWAN